MSTRGDVPSKCKENSPEQANGAEHKKHAAPQLLEVDANTHLHGSWGSSLNGELPEIGWRALIEEYWIQQLVVVQDVVDIE